MKVVRCSAGSPCSAAHIHAQARDQLGPGSPVSNPCRCAPADSALVVDPIFGAFIGRRMASSGKPSSSKAGLRSDPADVLLQREDWEPRCLGPIQRLANDGVLSGERGQAAPTKVTGG